MSLSSILKVAKDAIVDSAKKTLKIDSQSRRVRELHRIDKKVNKKKSKLGPEEANLVSASAIEEKAGVNRKYDEKVKQEAEKRNLDFNDYSHYIGYKIYGEKHETPLSSDQIADPIHQKKLNQLMKDDLSLAVLSNEQKKAAEIYKKECEKAYLEKNKRIGKDREPNIAQKQKFNRNIDRIILQIDEVYLKAHIIRNKVRPIADPEIARQEEVRKENKMPPLSSEEKEEIYESAKLLAIKENPSPTKRMVSGEDPLDVVRDVSHKVQISMTTLYYQGVISENELVYAIK